MDRDVRAVPVDARQGQPDSLPSINPSAGHDGDPMESQGRPVSGEEVIEIIGRPRHDDLHDLRPTGEDLDRSQKNRTTIEVRRQLVGLSEA